MAMLRVSFAALPRYCASFPIWQLTSGYGVAAGATFPIWQLTSGYGDAAGATFPIWQLTSGYGVAAGATFPIWQLTSGYGVAAGANRVGGVGDGQGRGTAADVAGVPRFALRPSRGAAEGGQLN